MRRLVRPWSAQVIDAGNPYGPASCLISEAGKEVPKGLEHAELMKGEFRGETRRLLLHPYPKRGTGQNPLREAFPIRPPLNREPRTHDEEFAAETLRRMNEVLARIQELEDALDDPISLWPRLRAAWKRAEDEADPRMAEIVKQSREIGPVLKDLELRIRRVLRRTRELTPLSRVQELDRASMLWLSRQPGRTVAERAGPAQRILSTVRHENFDTLENRVFHAYVRLAALVAREWQREHRRAMGSDRYRLVDAFRLRCRALSRDLADLGVGVAEPGITPNYVLMQDKGYRTIRLAWERLIRRERILDDLWAWQAQTWTDFAVLAIVLAIDEIEEAEPIAQSPIVWRQEAVTGRWFDQDRPFPISMWAWREETAAAAFLLSRSDQSPSLLVREDVEELGRRVLEEFGRSVGTNYTKFQYAPFLLVGLLRWRLKSSRALVVGMDQLADDMAEAVERVAEDMAQRRWLTPRLEKLAQRWLPLLEQTLDELRGAGGNPDLLADIYNV